MKKYLMFLLLIICSFGLVGCGKPEVRTIKIYNWSDYIGPGVLDDFVVYYEETYGEKIEYVYDTFETNESMYNTLKTGKTQYDVICPSDYMIQKMMREGMLETFDFENYDLDVYFKNCSPYLIELFEKYNWTEYAACYMWGTLGLVYNPDTLEELADGQSYDVNSWNILNNELFEGEISLKDSVRDAYCVGSLLANQDELKTVREQYGINSKEYNKIVQEVSNRVGDEDIEKVFKVLKEIKENLYGLEVDSGKGDIVTGKISMNLAWSGDAVYSMDQAEEYGNYLEYTIPVEGGNVWFDGWVMPKGADKQLAQAFINYLSFPSVAASNMEEIGYTAAIAGNEIFELIDSWYGRTRVSDDIDYCIQAIESGVDPDTEEPLSDEEIQEYIDWKRELEEATFTEENLTYFFKGTLDDEYYTDGEAVVDIYDLYIGRQFSTQYPDEETINRCGVMMDFEGQNEAVLEMWINFKANTASIWLIIGLVLFVLIVVGFILYSKRSYFSRLKRMKQK